MSQLEELESLTVIYKPEDFQFVRDTTTSLITGWYYAHPKLPQRTPTLQARIRVTSQITKLFPYTHPQLKRLDGALYKVYYIEHPPPLLVKFTLPQGYPETEAPLLRLECSWIPPLYLDEVVSRLNAFASCKIGEQCLWECFDYLECELLSSLLGLPREGDSLVYDVNERIPHRRMRDSALANIVGYDALERRRVFRESKVECEVCMDEDKLGAECTRLSGCEHVFCHECLREALK
ncbi:unnamed protein product, partial [Mesocestoides corti]|uniref:RWD domain-containing protein n=1 Tax=Mesocestoides corti TaxID=53468 RepID=A0A0R3UB25_MESCO